MIFRWAARRRWQGVLPAIALGFGALATGQATAGGLIAYEIGTADVGLASAGYNVRAQDASTVFTNPAGMTLLERTQLLGAGQVLWANTKFSIDDGTSAALGADDGGFVTGVSGWFLGGGSFLSYSVSPRLKVGMALTGNFGAPLNYDDDWVGRYYVQEATLIGLSIVPSIAYKVTEKLSLGASLNTMRGIYKNQVAVNNPDTLVRDPGSFPPTFTSVDPPDGQLKLEDKTWGFGFTLGALYEFTPATRFGLTYNSRVNLDFSAPIGFTGLSDGLNALLDSRGLLDGTLDVGITVPQQVMASVFHQINRRWAVLGSAGWQQWSKFGQLQIGVDSANPTSLTTSLGFKDTWHLALGAQYRVSDPWLLNFGVAYDSGFQSSSTVSPLLPADSAWRFGAGVQHWLRETLFVGLAAEYLYGGTLDVNQQSTAPVALGGRGDVVGSYNAIGTIFVAAYLNWTF
jgi:long-chain fatty acid transport protein